MNVEPFGELTAVHPYLDEAGETLFEVGRFTGQFSAGEWSVAGEAPPQERPWTYKTFRERLPGDGEWVEELPNIRRVLYRLPEVMDAVGHDSTVLFVEGEKDVDTLGEFGFVATTSPGGPKGWRNEYATPLCGATVVIIPDNDEVGRSYSKTVEAALLGLAGSVTVKHLPVENLGEDVSDWLKAGGSAEQLRALLGHA